MRQRPGALILVSNGGYATAGRHLRLDDQSGGGDQAAVCGASTDAMTVIQATSAGTTNGSSAVRCLWLTNGAVLSGFN